MTDSKELATTPDKGIQTTKSTYTVEQRDQLRALMDIGEASDADLNMLFEVSRRAGLDPFLREVWLIGRKTKASSAYRGGRDEWVTKWTVQTSIDGFRKSLHLYGASLGVPVNIGQPVFYTEDGGTQEIWLRKWGYPAAAKVTVTVGDNSATAVCTWDEYCQTKRDGTPNSQWEKFGPTMLAKCAESAAIRRVCPISLSMYVQEEMGAVDEIHMKAERIDEAAHGKPTRNDEIMAALTKPQPANAEAVEDSPQVEAVDVETFIQLAAIAETRPQLTQIWGEAKQSGLTEGELTRLQNACAMKAQEIDARNQQGE